MALIMLGDYDNGFRGLLVCIAYSMLLGLLTVDAFGLMGVRAERGKTPMLLWWCACAWSIPLGCFALRLPAEDAARAYPGTVLSKLVACKATTGRYPASLAEVDRFSLSRYLVEYKSNDQSFQFVLLSKDLFSPGRFTYSSGAKAWEHVSSD